MNEGSEFQTDGAAYRKALFASSILVYNVNNKVKNKVKSPAFGWHKGVHI